MGFPKALLDIGGETFLQRLVRVFSTCCSQVIAVLGHDADRIRSACDIRADLVVNELHELGQLSSLQCGLRAARADAEAVLYSPVDYPAISASTPRHIVSGFEPHHSFVIPRYEGRRGHPVMFAAELIPEFLALAPQQTAREVVHRHVDRTRYLDLSDPGIRVDVDHPHEYHQLVRGMV
jgi:CTP:molybdopterin cytidylyltransferase MocA